MKKASQAPLTHGRMSERSLAIAESTHTYTDSIVVSQIRAESHMWYRHRLAPNGKPNLCRGSIREHRGNKDASSHNNKHNVSVYRYQPLRYHK